MSRPILRVEPAAAPSRPVALPAAAAGLAASAVGLLVCIAVAVTAWFAADTGSFSAAIRTGALGWLLGSGASLQVGGVAVSAMPLGLTLAAAWMLFRGGRWVARHSTVSRLTDVATGAGCMGAAYAVVGLAAAAVTRTGDVHAGPLRLGLASVLLGVVFGGAGLLRGSGLAPRIGDRLPDEVHAAVVGAAAGVCVMLAAAALLVGVSLSQHFSTASTLAGALRAGAVGGVVMAVVGALAVPNAVLCAGAYIAGPGFALGSGTTVAPAGVTLGALPSFPLLAAVPQGGGGQWVEALIALPVLAGAVAGVTGLRRCPVRGAGAAAARGGLAGLAFGVAFGSLTWLATGAVGPGRMQQIGPDVLGTTAMCVAGGILGGAVAACCVQLTTERWIRAPATVTAGPDEPSALGADGTPMDASDPAGPGKPGRLSFRRR